jgi:hypothetical protein
LGGSPLDQSRDAFAPPAPLLGSGTGAVASVIYRDLPLITIATDWDVPAVRAALRSNMMGTFDAPAQLADATLGDDRVQATMGSRVAGLLGRETIFEPANDSAAARECCDAWIDCWDGVGGYGSLGWMLAYSAIMGWSVSQIVWDTSRPWRGTDLWRPLLRPWHPRYSYYHWTLRRFIALSQEGQIAIEPGNGKWAMLAPWGDYRPWVFGCLRAIAEPWLLRHYAFRDWGRFTEVHGIPTRLAGCPASASPVQRAQYEQALTRLTSETTILLAKGLEGQGSDYTLDLLEATDTAWECFPGLIDRADMCIVLSILFQNLTTEVTGGSFAATKAHMDVRQGGLERDDKAVQPMIRDQVARPFAFLNFGDPDLAPKTRYDVRSVDVHVNEAKLAAQVGQLIQYLRTSGVRVDNPDILFAAFGLDWKEWGVKFTLVDPVQVESSLAKATAADPDAEAGKGGKEGDVK